MGLGKSTPGGRKSRAQGLGVCATHPASLGSTRKAACESSLYLGLGSGFSEVVSVGAEHRPDFIANVAMISAPQGGALWAPLGGGFGVHGGGDRGARQREGYEGLGTGQGIVGEEKDCPPGWWKAWLPVSLAPVSWRAGEARGCQGETLASGRHSDQIRAR